MPPIKKVITKKVITTAIDRVDTPFAMQRIDNVKIIPGVSRVILQFDTLFATVPIVEVSRVDRLLPSVSNPILTQFPIFGGLRQFHTIEIRELESFTHHQFRIIAAGGPEGGLGLAKFFGDFFTGRRSGQILFDVLHIFHSADRDMYFNIEIYHGTGNNALLSRFLSGHKFLDGGQYNQPFPNTNLSSAPDSLRLSITGYNEDSSFTFAEMGFAGFAHGKGPDTLPDSVPDGNSYADSEQAILTGIIQTLELGQFSSENTQTIPFSLSSINKRFGYAIDGRIVYRVTDHPETIRRARVAELLKQAATSGTTMTVGQGLAVGAGGKKGRSHAFALGPNDTAYRQIDDGASRQSSWQQIGERLSGPLTALGSDTGRIDLFAAGKNGALIYAPLEHADDRKTKPVWYPLGDIVDPKVFPLRGPDGTAHLFGFDRSGAVRHLQIPVLGAKLDAAAAWDTLDGKFSGSLSVVAQKDTFHVFVSDPDRGIFYQPWPPKRDRSKTEWVHLAGFKGAASATLAEDGSLVIVGFEDGTPSAFKVRTASKGWGPPGWAKIRSEAPTRPARSRKVRVREAMSPQRSGLQVAVVSRA
jgi:hypothetical protein